MKLQANVQLNLPKTYNTITLVYNTYEKASFDQYLIASVCLRSENKEVANNYIEELTGKGSLNAHFKKILNKMYEFDREYVKKILSDSLYPTTKIDKTNRYVYYPYFNISVINKKIYHGNIGELSFEELKELLMIDYDLINFSVDTKEQTDRAESYYVLFDENEMRLNLVESEWVSISNKQFSESYKKPDIDITKYMGYVKNNPDGVGWNILTAVSFNSIIKSSNIFNDTNGDCCILTHDYIKKIEIAKLFGLYFYRETKLDFTKKNQYYCELAVAAIINYGWINEYKVKSLVSLLKIVSDITAQEVINYVLYRKDSKELSLLAFDLISQGLEKNWDEKALNSMLQFASQKDLNYIYKISSTLDYTLSMLLLINNDLLTEADIARKEKYISDRKNKIREIQNILGEVSGSGLREKIKSTLPQSAIEVKKFTKLCNELLAHNKESLDDMSDDKLDAKFNKIKEFKEIFIIIKKMYDEVISK